jgi:hypothetical protein
MIALAEREEQLVEALRALPPAVSEHVATWVAQLRELGEGRSVDYSDTWSEEDMADARRASLRTFDVGQ